MALKAQGKTYRDVAVALGLTEASVKRLFSKQSFSLHRLDQVCQLLEMEITDLAQFADDCFGSVSFLRHDPVLLSVENTNLKPGPVFSGQVSFF